MDFILLDKFEKEKRVIELHLAGKTIREIAKEVHMSFRDISRIIKAYDKKARLETKRESLPQSKKLSKGSQAYNLFLDRKTPVDVAIDLNLDFDKVRKYWTEFLRLQNMKELYNIYIENEYHLDYIFRIYYFILRNRIDLKDMENILKIIADTAQLYKTNSNLKSEIARMRKVKNDYQKDRITHQLLPLKPLPFKSNYNY